MPINHLDDRSAMGLHNKYVSSRFESLEDVYKTLGLFSKKKLTYILESPNESIEYRYIAGKILGYYGDDRINVLQPHMLKIPGNNVELGLKIEEIDNIEKSLKDLETPREWLEKETPSYQIKIHDFYLSKYLVTNKEYKTFLEDSGYDGFPSSWQFGIYPESLSNFPVYTVLPEDADEYCKWLSIKTGRNFKLPSEAQWEYASSGGKNISYPWGNHFGYDMCNTIESKIYHTTPVGMFSAGDSIFGVSDMAGNVEEYVSDAYSPYPNGKIIIDDLYLKCSNYRIVRGGSFSRYRDLARCKRRHGYIDKNIFPIGFRIAETL